MIDVYGLNDLRRFIALFPDSLVSKCIRGYLLYTGQTLTTSADSDDNEEAKPVKANGVDPLDLALVCFPKIHLGSD